MAKQSFPNIKKVHQSVFPNVVFGSSENMSMKSDLFTFGSLRWPPIILCVYQSSVACLEGDSQRRQFVGKIKKYFWKNLNLPPRLLKKYVERRWQGAWGQQDKTTIQSIFLTTMHSSTRELWSLKLTELWFGLWGLHVISKTGRVLYLSQYLWNCRNQIL